ncbi:hypothetical protein DNTS_003098 [Danionella cerebrum]|uniref:Prolyl 4-hydroxylase N-terminal domain-containing protein n=1 Tax=Danionella cerebrum TaxID=2873325 RepID=A0A553N0C7_9TELE|nr:hypothetical protein DNTS_003098 [Danionella translucida]
MELKWMYLLLLAVWTSCFAIEEFYSSTEHMTQLLSVRKEFSRSLRRYLEALDNRMNFLRGTLNALEEGFEDTPKDPESLLSHPLAAFKLVSRLSRARDITLNLLEEQHAEESKENLHTAAQGLPREDDVQGVVMALIRLQEIYRLDPWNFSLLSEKSHNLTLDPNESFQIAAISALHHRLHYALLWMEDTLRRLDEGQDASITKDEVLYQRASINSQLAITRFLPGLETFSKDLYSGLYQILTESTKTWDMTSPLLNHVASLHPMEKTYRDLCSGTGAGKVMLSHDSTNDLK